MPRIPIRPATQHKSKTALDPDQIVKAALQLLDEVGLDGLTMRRLADQLNIKAASLYWHVRDKEELILLLANEISGKVNAPDPDLPWRKQLEHFGTAYRQMLLAHRDAARVMLLSGPPSGENRLDLVEIMLRMLLNAGFSPKDAAFAGFLLNDYVTTFVMEETREMVHTEGENPGGNWIEGLPRDRYPSIIALASHWSDINMDEQFRFGVEVLLDGLEKRLKSKD